MRIRRIGEWRGGEGEKGGEKERQAEELSERRT